MFPGVEGSDYINSTYLDVSCVVCGVWVCGCVGGEGVWCAGGEGVWYAGGEGVWCVGGWMGGCVCVHIRVDMKFVLHTYLRTWM